MKKNGLMAVVLSAAIVLAGCSSMSKAVKGVYWAVVQEQLLAQELVH